MVEEIVDDVDRGTCDKVAGDGVGALVGAGICTLVGAGVLRLVGAGDGEGVVNLGDEVAAESQ